MFMIYPVLWDMLEVCSTHLTIIIYMYGLPGVWPIRDVGAFFYRSIWDNLAITIFRRQCAKSNKYIDFKMSRLLFPFEDVTPTWDKSFVV